MPRRIETEKIEIQGPTVQAVERMWQQIVGDGSAVIKAEKIIKLVVKPKAAARPNAMVRPARRR